MSSSWTGFYTDIKITRQVKELWNRNNIQINSLDRIDPDVLAGFTSREKKIFIIHNNKVVETELESGNKDIVTAAHSDPAQPFNAGEHVVIVFPVSGKTKCVMQATVDTLGVGSVSFKGLDPRYNRRYRVDVAGSFWELPYVLLVSTLDSGELKIVRKISTETEKTGRKLEKITDLFLETKTKQIAEKYLQLVEKKTCQASLVDISAGGLCASIKVSMNKDLTGKVLYFEFRFPSCRNKKGDDYSLTVQSLSVVRQQRTVPETTYLHVVFFQQLPEIASRFFEDCS